MATRKKRVETKMSPSSSTVRPSGQHNTNNEKMKNKTKYDADRAEICDLEKRCSQILDASTVAGFVDLPLSRRTLAGLSHANFIEPTEIQRQSLTFSLRGLDVLGAAKTGSGKTLAFVIPILERLYRTECTHLDGLAALVITPVRELAYQIFAVLRDVGQQHDFSAGLIIGGRQVDYERARLDHCNIIVCTPGRLLQHMDENPLFDTSNLKILVLDEADRILDMGFSRDMNAILENLPKTRQTMLFSATQTKSVKDLARLSLRDPLYVSVHENAKHSTPEALKQSYVVCELHEKISVLWSFIKHHLKHKILVFMTSCKQVRFVYQLFCQLHPGTVVMALFGTMQQTKRVSIYEQFCSRRGGAILLATDIAARGLDFPSVDWVVQADCPCDANEYIHRAGRTARNECRGEALLFLTPSEEEAMLDQLRQRRIPIDRIRVNPKKQLTIGRKAEALLARDVTLKQNAQSAFVSYVKSIFLMKNKQVFDVKKLDTDAYARSLGLAIPPRIRFLQKQEKNNNQKRKTVESKMKEQISTKVKLDNKINVKTLTTKKPTNDFSLLGADVDSDEELFNVKSRTTPSNKNQEMIDVPLEPLETIRLSRRPLTKVALAKKILKKNKNPNAKVAFDEDGEAMVDDIGNRQLSEAAKSTDREPNEDGGLNIAKAIEVLREEDKLDKKLFAEKIRAKHREKRLKEKMWRQKEKSQALDEDVRLGDSDSDDADSVDLDFLPDPDKIYGKTGSDDEGSDQSGKHYPDNIDSLKADNEETPSMKNLKLKRKKNRAESNKKMTKRHRTSAPDSNDNTGLSLMEDEELALQLLSAK